MSAEPPSDPDVPFGGESSKNHISGWEFPSILLIAFGAAEALLQAWYNGINRYFWAGIAWVGFSTGFLRIARRSKALQSAHLAVEVVHDEALRNGLAAAVAVVAGILLAHGAVQVLTTSDPGGSKSSEPSLHQIFRIHIGGPSPTSPGTSPVPSPTISLPPVNHPGPTT